MVCAPSQEQEPDPLVPVAGSWLNGCAVTWSLGAEPMSHQVAERRVGPTGERRFPVGLQTYLLEEAVLAQTYH